mmetsp:Transcript_13104/g.14046  ORF Transcript_13104/g.14046 Transcript_13104/m.14046 type:complete len:648 (+) Transcript_13104:66-2009(+)
MTTTRKQETQKNRTDVNGNCIRSSSTRRSSARINKVEKDEEEYPALNYNKGTELTQEEKASDDEGDEKPDAYVLDGVEFNNYQDFVIAKRKRNQKVLMSLGFGPSSSENKRLKITDGTTIPSQRGIRSNKKKSAAKKVPLRSRKSSRISGDKTKLIALDYFVNDWNRDNTATIVSQEGEIGEDADDNKDQREEFFNGRVNDGTDLSLKDAIELNDPKWIHDDSIMIAESIFKGLKPVEESFVERSSCKLEKIQQTRAMSPTSVISSIQDTVSWEAEIAGKVEELSINNEECVAKVTPDRIYSVAAHPSESKLICCAGDKQGYVGLWDVDGGCGASSENKNNKNSNGVSLFRVHSRPICCLEWLNNENLVTASYDGSIRRLNVETGTFQEIFATYDDSDTTYAEDLGFGLDQGYRYWTQNVMVDHRYKGASNPSLFVSTSIGDVFHVDLRVGGKQSITFHESLSEKKVNTVSLHPNGTTLAASGNDGTVRLFDIRKFHDSRGGLSTKKSPKSLCIQTAGRSINSSFFSPSGKKLLTTSFADRVDITEDAHLHKGGVTVKPTHSIRHNNQTGRWLTTFQATWHPKMDIFCCGSLNKPRCMEIFDAQGRLLRQVVGESLTSVMSRTCFHPSTDKLIMVGGNSSGRMVAIR